MKRMTLLLVLGVLGAAALVLSVEHWSRLLPEFPDRPQATGLGIPGPSDAAPTMVAEHRQIHSWLAAADHAALDRFMQQAVVDYKAGRLSDLALRNLFYAFQDAPSDYAPQYDAWIRAYPRSYSAYVARAIYLRTRAEDQRGDAAIGDTDPARLAEMQATLEGAFKDLLTSLSLDDRPVVSYVHLIGIGRHVKDAAFLRRQWEASLRVAPDNFIVRRAYLRALRPRWHGSMEEMVAFVEESRAQGIRDAELSELESLVEEERGWLAERRANRSAGPEDAQQYAAVAVQHYANAVRAFPTSNPELWQAYARVLSKTRDCVTLLPVLDRLVAEDDEPVPNLSWVYATRSWCHGRRQHKDQSLADLRKAAELGDAWSQVELGEFLYHGRWMPRDETAARQLFERAAQQGDERGRKLAAGIHDH